MSKSPGMPCLLVMDHTVSGRFSCPSSPKPWMFFEFPTSLASPLGHSQPAHLPLVEACWAKGAYFWNSNYGKKLHFYPGSICITWPLVSDTEEELPSFYGLMRQGHLLTRPVPCPPPQKEMFLEAFCMPEDTTCPKWPTLREPDKLGRNPQPSCKPFLSTGCPQFSLTNHTGLSGAPRVPSPLWRQPFEMILALANGL